MIPKEIQKYNLHYDEVRGGVLRPVCHADDSHEMSTFSVNTKKECELLQFCCVLEGSVT